MALTEQLSFHARTDPGRRRKHNEDNYLVDPDLGLFVVADGMGGHAAGEIASAIAVRTIHEIVLGQHELLQERSRHGPRSEVSQKEILGLLEFAVQEASRRVHADAQTDARKRGMGTTVSLLLLLEAHAYVAHVGDSRIYMVRESEAHPITEDHTIANELLRMGIVSAEAVHNVPRKNAITRAVGVYEHVEVDTLTVEVLPNDEFVLCSDGLAGYLDDRGTELFGMLEDAEAEDAVDALVDFANDQGGKDNITVVLVRVAGGEPADTARAQRLALEREVLVQLPLFSRLNERELLRVMQAADVFEYEAGETVVAEGEAGDRMYVALRGRLEVATGGSTLGELGPGEHFGEMSLIRNRPRSADVRALELSELLTIQRDDFFEIIRTEHRLAVKLLWQFLGVLANRLERTSRDLRTARGEAGASAERGFWIDEEPSLDPFATPPTPVSSYLPPRPVTLPGIDDGEDGDIAEPPLEAPPMEQAPPMAQAPALAERQSTPPPEEETGPVTQRRPHGGDTDEMPEVREQEAEQAPDEDAEAEGFDARRTLPVGQRPRSETMKSARSEDSTGKGKDPRAQTTVRDGKLRRERDEALEQAQGFKPTKRTIPLKPDADFQEELSELRKEFKERLARSRKERGKKGE